MNTWNAIGTITLAFGIVFLINFLYLHSQTGSTFDAELPWINYMVLSWIISVVAMVKGSNLKITSDN